MPRKRKTPPEVLTDVGVRLPDGLDDQGVCSFPPPTPEQKEEILEALRKSRGRTGPIMPAPPRWEYKKTWQHDPHEGSTLEADLAVLGSEGWELLFISPDLRRQRDAAGEVVVLTGWLCFWKRRAT